MLSISFVNKGIAQHDKLLKGFIIDADSKEPLIGASILILSKNTGAITDFDGYFELKFTENKNYDLVISYIGYTSDTISIDVNNISEINIELAPSNYLDEVLISNKNSIAKNNYESNQMSAVDLSMDQISKLPAILSENDVLKAIQLLPGIQSSEGAATGYYVRGGSSDQNLILLNNATIYNPFHAAGFISIFNGDFIEDITIYKGAFPSSYGGRLSSLLNVETKEASYDKIKGSAGIGLVTAKTTLEFPIVKNKLSLLVSGRAFYSYSLVRAFLPADVKKDLPQYYFYDSYNQLNWKASKKDDISAFFYKGKDLVSFADRTDSYTSEFNIPWSNLVAGASWKHKFSDQLISKLTTYYTDYDFRFETSFSGGSAQNLKTKIQEWGVKFNMSQSKENHYLNYGVESSYKIIAPSVTKDKDFERIANVSEEFRPVDIAAFINDDWEINSRFGLNYGLRATYFYQNKQSYFALDPKVVGKIKVTDVSSIKFGYSYSSQFIHMLINSTATTPLDLWVSSTKVIKPQKAHAVQLGYYQNFKDNKYEFSVEGYYKNLSNQIEYKEGVDVFSNESIENKLLFGDGWTSGAEFFIRKRTGKLNGFIGYTLAWAKRDFEELNDGKQFAYKYDRRHDLTMSFNYQINEKWSVSALFVIGTGHALTVPQDVYYSPKPNGSGSYYIDYGERNSFRLKPYHRLDLSVKYSGKPKRVQSHLKLDLYNIYNRKNTFFALLGTESNRGSGFNAVMKEYAIIPILPSLSYQIEF